MPEPLFNPLRYINALTPPKWITDASAWVTHIPFAMAAVEMLQPRVFVELGTLKGDSYCAFCQSVALNHLPTRCFAVDSWQGDVHVKMPHGEKILADLRAHHDPLYGSFSTLLPMTFDEAVKQFADGSIDLLHIDGCHTYEAVKHDFETWLPKLSDRAVVLFHDTCVREKTFGVWKLWEEISRGRPNFEFRFGHGLGVLATGTSSPAPFLEFLQQANANKEAVETYFFTVGHRIELFRVANQMINGLATVHQLLEPRLKQIGRTIDPLPNPVNDPRKFIERILIEVSEVARG